GARLEHAHRVAAVAAASDQERTVLREHNGVDLLKGTRRLPFCLPGCEAGALDRLIVAAAHERLTVRCEGNGCGIKIVARHNPHRRFGPEIVESYVLPDPTGERLATGLKSERQESPRLVGGPQELAGGGIPDLPLALATRIGSLEVRRIAPAVVSPIAAPAGE